MYLIQVNITRDTVIAVKSFSNLDSLSRKVAHINMLVYGILNNLINCIELLSKIGICTPYRNTKYLDLFIIPYYSTKNGNNTFF